MRLHIIRCAGKHYFLQFSYHPIFYSLHTYTKTFKLLVLSIVSKFSENYSTFEYEMENCGFNFFSCKSIKKNNLEKNKKHFDSFDR